MPSGFSWIGIPEMLAKVAQFERAFPDHVAQALRVETEVAARKVKRRTPVAPDGGTLRASVHAEGPFREGTKIFTLIVAGGPAIQYAIVVHEHPSEYDPPSWRGKEIEWNAAGTGPKFIESVLLELVPYLAANIARRINLKEVLNIGGSIVTPGGVTSDDDGGTELE